MSIYADTSLFASPYLPDRYSVEAERRMASKPWVWLTPLHIAEWTHAIAQHVFRKEISVREAGVVQAELELDREAGLRLEIDLPESVWEAGTHLARQHGPKLGTRTPHSMDVAAALELGAKSFWTFDDGQAKLAIAEGFTTSRRCMVAATVGS
ncbi:MAG TPA: type II toxin-antitoxin system VapC family toxin [Candidatus Sulfotelmatobacter sp.]|nr:type II toxin-antitoxin system VapC family toxin [Candidatus Sulfotelmatobacter sp.]